MYQYEHGGAIRYKYPDVLDFSANINPLGLPEGVFEAITAAIPTCTVYPDPHVTALREKIGTFEGVSPRSILCTNGASDLIFRLPLALKAKKALVLSPTFSDYERALQAAGASVSHYPLSEENGFVLTADILPFLENERFDLIYLCNPNNPTGCLIPPGLVEEILRLTTQWDGIVAVDECFLDFVPGNEQLTAKPLLPQYQNLIIIKAFTKTFSLAGIRLGYGISANETLLDALTVHAPDWSVSTLAMAAGIAALNTPQDFLTRTRTYVEKEKKQLLAGFQALGLPVFGSSANYIFFKAAPSFGEALLLKHKICIRSCGNYHVLDGSFYRMGISDSSANQRLLAAFQDMIGE